MPSWDEILKEIQNNHSEVDTIRRKNLKKVSDISGRNTIAYYSGFLQKPGIQQSAINDNDKNGFMATIHKLDRSKGLDIILHTNGLELGNIPKDILNSIDAIMLSINYEKIPPNRLNEGYFRVIADAIMSIRRKRQIPIIGRMTITEQTSIFSELALLNGLPIILFCFIIN